MKINGYQTTYHINIYLPTSGKENEYVEELSKLSNVIEDIEHPDVVTYVRGDANASFKARKKNGRDTLFRHFVNSMGLHHNELNHVTYHHFTGDGASDSSIDVLLESKDGSSETLSKIVCSKNSPNIDSHHDLIISKVVILPSIPKTEIILPEAPKISNN